MEFAISRRGRLAQPQPISYLMAQGVSGDCISLAAGLVDAGSLPTEGVAGCMSSFFAGRGRAGLQYGTTEGLVSLREKVRKRLSHADGLDVDSIPLERVMLSTGSQQMLYILTEIMVDPGDIVITAAPTYFVYLGTLETAGAQVLSVPIDEQGLRVEELAKLLGRIEHEGRAAKVKIIYTADYFQNPSGMSLSLDRRQELAALLGSFESMRPLIIEDAAYRELRFESDDTRSLWSIDGGRRVAYLGTFSKPFSPGLRTGFSVLPEGLIDPVRVVKGNHDFGSAGFNQHVIDCFIDEGLYDVHVEKLRALYAEKCGLMCKSLTQHLEGRAEWVRPKGGLYVWVRIPGLDTGMDSPLFKRCVANGVLYVPGIFAYSDRPSAPKDMMRLSFGPVSSEEIVEGVGRLAMSIEQVSSGCSGGFRP